MAYRSTLRFRVTFSLLFLILAAAVFASSALALRAARRTFEEKRDAVSALYGRAQRADALEQRWERVSEKAALIESAFLSRETLPDFFAAVEATAAAAGVTESTSIVQSSSPSRDVKGKAAEPSSPSLRFRFHVEGDFPKLFTFVTHVNVLPTLLFVEEVSFQTASTTSREGGQPSADVVVRVPLRGGETAPTSEEVEAQVRSRSKSSSAPASEELEQ